MKQFIGNLLIVGFVCAAMSITTPNRAIAASGEVNERVQGAHHGSDKSNDSGNQAVLSVDHAFVQALAKGEKATVAKMLDPEFDWVGEDGEALNKSEVLEKLPTPMMGAESGADVKERTYGEVGTVQSSSGKMHVLRVWVQRPAGWQLLVYHEVKQLEAPPSGGAGGTTCENPCKGVPYHPKNEAEAAVLKSWGELETGVVSHESSLWKPHMAEEFVQISSNNDHVLDKTARAAILDKQKQTNTPSAPAYLVAAHMFDFPSTNPQTIVMTCLNQPYHGKPIHVTRVWIDRDGKWVMAISYQTTIEDAPAVP